MAAENHGRGSQDIRADAQIHRLVEHWANAVSQACRRLVSRRIFGPPRSRKDSWPRCSRGVPHRMLGPQRRGTTMRALSFFLAIWLLDAGAGRCAEPDLSKK